MKGNSATKIYPPHAYGNYDKVKMGQDPVGPYHVWQNRLTGSKMKLPVGVTGGKNWERVR